MNDPAKQTTAAPTGNEMYKLPTTSVGPVPDFRRNRRMRLSPELNRQFDIAIREMDRNLAPLLGLELDEQSYNEYTYSSGEHRPYGRIERNY